MAVLAAALLQSSRCGCYAFTRSSAAFSSRIGSRIVPTKVATTTTATNLASRNSSLKLPFSYYSTTKIKSVTEDVEEATQEAAVESSSNDRLSRNGASLEIRTIVNDLDMVLSHLESRRASQETMDAVKTIASLQEQRVSLIQDRDEQLNIKNTASATIGKLMRQGPDNLSDDDKAALETAKESSVQATEKASVVETELEKVQTQVDTLLNSIPNLLDDNVPDGDDENDNEEIYKWGDIDALPSKFQWTDDFEPQWHDDVAAKCNGYSVEEAVKISGARFVALSGPIAQLERAIAMYFLDMHTTKHGYTEMSVPFVVGRSALMGTSQLPKFEEDLFAITPQSHTCNGEDAFLIPTAEVPLTNLHREAVLEEDNLPLSYVAWTPCFRAEAGSYGRDTKGLIRTHQFHKVELVKITTAQDSDEQHEALTKHAEACLQALELPYRKVRLCSGDIGFSARHCYDLEVWLPGAKEYREISSCSNTGDFQARRMSLRYRPNPPPENTSEAQDGGKKKKKKKAKKPKPQLCHTINGSGLAVGRTLVAVLENYQQVDGSVVVPEVLRPYMGGKEVIPAA